MKSITKTVALLLICASAMTLGGCVLAIGNKDGKPRMCGQDCCLRLKSPNGTMWRVSVDDNGQIKTKPAGGCAGCQKGATDAKSIGAPTKYSPDQDTEPIPTVDLGAKK